MAKSGIIFEDSGHQTNQLHSTPPSHTRYTNKGTITASGLGGEKKAYKKLLLDICHAGVVLNSISMRPWGLTGVVVEYTVEGTLSEIELYRWRAS
jgi:hypothetical protein